MNYQVHRRRRLRHAARVGDDDRASPTRTRRCRRCRCCRRAAPESTSCAPTCVGQHAGQAVDVPLPARRSGGHRRRRRPSLSVDRRRGPLLQVARQVVRLAAVRRRSRRSRRWPSRRRAVRSGRPGARADADLARRRCRRSRGCSRRRRRTGTARWRCTWCSCTATAWRRGAALRVDGDDADAGRVAAEAARAVADASAGALVVRVAVR